MQLQGLASYRAGLLAGTKGPLAKFGEALDKLGVNDMPRLGELTKLRRSHSDNHAAHAGVITDHDRDTVSFVLLQLISNPSTHFFNYTDMLVRQERLSQIQRLLWI